MKRSDKESFVADFQEKLKRTSVLYLTDFSGLDVKSMTSLRHRLDESGAQYIVIKNRLAALALEGLDLPDITEHLKGPTGVILGEDGAVEPAKALSDFAKEHGDRPVFKVGILDKALLEPTQFARLAKLPPKEELLAELAGVMQAPLSAMLGALQGKLQETAGLLEALRRQQEGQEGQESG